jgi:cardiolipin synthase
MVRKRAAKRSRRFVIGATIGVTLLVVLLGLNVARGRNNVTRHIPSLYAVHDPQFLRTMGVLLGPAIAGGNHVDVLLNGDEIFPKMLEAIRGARKTITFETYIYWSDAIGHEFADALAERSRAGVKVHVLVDWVGAKMDKADLAKMQDAGVELRMYRALRWYNLSRLNNRTHRKLLVVDGHVGFTGGVGVAAQWTGHAQDPDHWRDTHFRVVGPVVSQLQAAFMDNWVAATGEVLHGGDYFPAPQPSGAQAAQVFISSPTGGSASMQLMYMLAIAAARRSIYVSSAYFIPDPLTEEMLVAAVKRGVKVQIVAPGGHIDSETVRRASRARWGDLLEAGAEIYEYQPTMYHCKVMIVDELFTSVGSTNFDPRSFGLNAEANLNVFDGDFAARQIEIFREDVTHSRLLSFADWRRRPLTEKLFERFASLLGPVL